MRRGPVLGRPGTCFKSVKKSPVSTLRVVQAFRSPLAYYMWELSLTEASNGLLGGHRSRYTRPYHSYLGSLPTSTPHGKWLRRFLKPRMPSSTPPGGYCISHSPKLNKRISHGCMSSKTSRSVRSHVKVFSLRRILRLLECYKACS